MLTTTELIDEIRSLADEHNTAAWTDDRVLAAANRGLRYVVSKLVEDYPEPLLVRAEIATTSYDADEGLEIPDDCYENRVVYVQMDTPGRPTPVEARTSRTIGAHEYDSSVAVPAAWYPRKRRVVLAPPPNGTYAALLDYVQKPDPLVPVWGRVTSVGATYIVVDDLSTDVSSAGDEVESYVNVVDGSTGEIRGTFQVGHLEGGKLTLRATPVASTKMGRAVSGSASISTLGVAEDDYICHVRGTCVTQFGDMFSSYVVDYAAACISRALAEATASISEAIARRAKEDAAQQRAGRGATRRIKNRSRVWGGASFSYPRQTNS